MRTLLEERSFPVDEIRFFASSPLLETTSPARTGEEKAAEPHFSWPKIRLPRTSIPSFPNSITPIPVG